MEPYHVDIHIQNHSRYNVRGDEHTRDAKAKPQQVTVTPSPAATAASSAQQVPTEEEKLACSLANPDGCLMCSG